MTLDEFIDTHTWQIVQATTKAGVTSLLRECWTAAGGDAVTGEPKSASRPKPKPKRAKVETVSADSDTKEIEIDA